MKQQHIDKLTTRVQQQIRVLTHKPSFQQAIAKLRLKWEIPKNGFETISDMDEWNRNLQQKNQKYFDNNSPTIKASLLEKKAEGNLVEHNKILKKFNDNSPLSAFTMDLKKVAFEQKLSPRWVQGVKHYLFLNDPKNFAMNIGPIVTTEYDPDFDTQKILIEIDTNTTQKDIKAIWPMVKTAQKGLLSRTKDKFQPMKQFERNEKAYNLHQSGKSYEKIAEELSTPSKTYGYEDVSKMIERYKKTVDIN